MSYDNSLSPADAVRAAAAAIPIHPCALLTEVQAAEVLNLSIRMLQAEPGLASGIEDMGRPV